MLNFKAVDLFLTEEIYFDPQQAYKLIRNKILLNNTIESNEQICCCASCNYSGLDKSDKSSLASFSWETRLLDR